MEKQTLVGRKYETSLLNDALHSTESELVVIYGRRRVGKTFLVNEFFNNTFDFKFTGIYQKSTNTQLERFAVSMSEQFCTSIPIPKTWYEAFDQLKSQLKDIVHEGKKVVFIDEMPWLDTDKSNFVSAFESFWNGWAAAEGDILLIACGSATSWITDTLLGDQGGLFNRAAIRIFIQPFSLAETEEYLQSKGIDWARYDIAECYMIMGGIPFYLKQLNPRWSYTQNIDNIFFREKGLLWDEFEHLYRTLFKQADNHILVVEALAKKKMGLTRKEIIEATHLPDNGKLGKILHNLESNGFVRPYCYFGNKKQDTIYQLSDFYTMFYFTYIKDYYGKDPHFWTNSLDNPSRQAWARYTFEQLCKSHINQIRQSLGISAVLCDISSWFSKGDRAKGKKGAQIDLLIDRRDRVISICEIKYSINEYSIDSDYEAILRNKLDVFRQETNTRKSLQLVMITTYGVKQGKYSNRIQGQVVLDNLFSGSTI